MLRSVGAESGAKEIIEELHKRDYKCVCFSGGFKNATVPFAKKLNLDAEFSNIFHVKDDVLTGKVGGEMMFSDSKGNMLLTLQRLLNIVGLIRCPGSMVWNYGICSRILPT